MSLTVSLGDPMACGLLLYLRVACHPYGQWLGRSRRQAHDSKEIEHRTRRTGQGQLGQGAGTVGCPRPLRDVKGCGPSTGGGSGLRCAMGGALGGAFSQGPELLDLGSFLRLCTVCAPCSSSNRCSMGTRILWMPKALSPDSGRRTSNRLSGLKRHPVHSSCFPTLEKGPRTRFALVC